MQTLRTFAHILALGTALWLTKDDLTLALAADGLFEAQA